MRQDFNRLGAAAGPQVPLARGGELGARPFSSASAPAAALVPAEPSCRAQASSCGHEPSGLGVLSAPSLVPGPGDSGLGARSPGWPAAAGRGSHMLLQEGGVLSPAGGRFSAPLTGPAAVSRLAVQTTASGSSSSAPRALLLAGPCVKQASTVTCPLWVRACSLLRDDTCTWCRGWAAPRPAGLAPAATATERRMFSRRWTVRLPVI